MRQHMQASKAEDIEELHWQTLKRWKKENVHHSAIADIGRYEFTDEDTNDKYYSDLSQRLVGEARDFVPAKMEKLIDNDEAEFHILGHFEQNLETGERYLRVAMREWYQQMPSAEQAAAGGEPVGDQHDVQAKLKGS